MKHILFKSCRLLLFILLLVFQLQPNLFAQCGNNTISGVSADGSTEDMTSSSLTIRVYFVLVRRNDGSGDIQESILSGIMSELAANYTATHNITFVQGCTQFIDSTSMYNDGSILAVNLTTFGQKYGTGLGITVFIQKEDSGTGILGQAGTNPVFPQPYCWFKYAAVNDIASHEIGHTLNLYHTDFMGFGKPCTAIAAHDTTRGDLVADTPIDYFHSEPVVACAWDTSQCRGRFPNPCLDSCGGFLLNVDPTIIMSNLDYSCVNHFTTGQANRMKKSIMNNTNGTYFDLVDADVTISTNTTISTPTRYARNVIVEPGVSLVVTSTVYMPQKGRIILQPGAILSINGGTITKGTFPDMCNERTGDPKFWYGIEMQTSTSSSYPKLYCTNGTIEFSEFGIHNDSSRVAGNLLINIASGTFRNNKHSIHILRGPYNAALPIFVKKARFYIDGSFPLANYYTQVKIDNSKIYFDSCKFDNPSTKHPLDSNSYSIRAMGATVGIQRTTFKDSLYGVQSLSAISTSTLNVTTSKFSKMFVGVNTTAGVNNYSITKDTFDTSWKYGLLSTQCTGYNINNNLFNNTGYHSNSVGILMQESGVVYNYIQKNVFSYLKYGDIAQGTNGDANVGLQYRCNTHDNNNTKDFLLQGMVSGLQGSKNNAAGNTSDSYVSFDLTSSNVGKITYHYRDISGERPTSTPSGKMNKVVVDSLNCSLIGHPDTMTHIQVYVPRKDTMIIRHDLYIDSIDGGNTSSMLSNIAAATSGTATSIYNGVMSRSPWLSSDVALALYNRNDLYDSTKRAQILYRNPDLFRSRAFRSAVADASSPLPTSSLESLDTLTNFTTSRTKLEAEISDLHQEMSALCYDKLNELKIDTLDNSDSILVWLDRADDYGSRRELVEVHYVNGEFTDASSALSDLGGLSGLTATQTSDIDGLGDLLPYLIDVRDDDRYEGTLNDTEIDWMIDFAADNANQAGEEVKSILNFYYDIDVDGSESLKQSHDKVHAIHGDNVIVPKPSVVSDGINIYPNPSKNELIILLPSKETAWNIDLLDLNGRLLSRSSTDSIKAKIDLSGLNTGVYLIHLTNAKGESINKRIQVIK